ncbi:dimethylmenaquinone methyltransferase, partial [Methylobacterium sp. WL103]
VHPGDVVVGGPDGVVVIPADIAEAVALEAVEQQRLDLWLTREAEKGASLATLLPPDAATLARYEAETKA